MLDSECWMRYVLESNSTSLSADRANSCTVPEILQDQQMNDSSASLISLLNVMYLLPDSL